MALSIAIAFLITWLLIFLVWRSLKTQVSPAAPDVKNPPIHTVPVPPQEILAPTPIVETVVAAQMAPEPVTVPPRRSSEELKALIIPYVEEAKTMEARGGQKKIQVILSFLKAHPGISFDDAAAAIEIALEEIRSRGH